jgi:hypothetical protein
LETEPPASDESTPPESTPELSSDEPVPAVPTKETTPIWAQTNPAAPAHKKGEPDWSKTESSTNGDGGKPAPAWAATVPTSPGDADENESVESEPMADAEAEASETEEPSAAEPAATASEPPAAAKLTDPPRAVAADALKSTWPPASASSPAPPEETDIWPPEPPTEHAMPAWPPSSEIATHPEEPLHEEEPAIPAQAIPSWPDSLDAAAGAPTQPPAPPAPLPPTITPEPKPAAPPPPTTVQPAAQAPVEAPMPSKPPVPTVPVTPAAPPTPPPAPATATPVQPAQAGLPARPAWAPAPAAEPVTPTPRSPSVTPLQVPAWAPRVPLASEPGTPTWFSPKEEIPHATTQPLAQSTPPAVEAAPAPPVVGGQLPVAHIPAPQQPAHEPTKPNPSTWAVVEQPRKSGPHAPAQAGPTAEDRSYAEWFAWAKRGGAPASACHAAAQGAFKALASGKDVNTAVQWATAAMGRPPEQVSYARQQYCAWFALANIDLNLDQHRAHLFAAGAIQALDAGQDASAAHAAGLAAAGIR